MNFFNDQIWIKLKWFENLNWRILKTEMRTKKTFIYKPITFEKKRANYSVYHWNFKPFLDEVLDFYKIILYMCVGFRFFLLWIYKALFLKMIKK